MAAACDTRDTAYRFWDSDGEDKIPIWLDCDTGHDDAFATLLAAYCPRLHLLGVSTVHGNSSLVNTTRNTLSILEAIGKRDIPVYPGASRPYCREAAYAPDIHGESGLDGTTILPVPVAAARTSKDGHDNAAVDAIYTALSSCAPGTAWLVATGALTNIALVFALYPSLADHIAGLSIMGGAIGGFFTNAPLGRLKTRIPFSSHFHPHFPAGGLPDCSGLSQEEVLSRFRELHIVPADADLSDDSIKMFIQEARQSFGNTTPFAEFNIYIDPESASAIFSNSRLAAKTTLIPLDITHQVLGNTRVMSMLSGNVSEQTPSRLATTPLRHLFLEILRFFAATYEHEFGMTDGPPLHDPIAVAAAFAPALFDDNGGERFRVHVVKEGRESPSDLTAIARGGEGGGGVNDDGVGGSKESVAKQDGLDVGQCGRTIAVMLGKGERGIRIPRTLDVDAFWTMMNFALDAAEKNSKIDFANE